MANQVDVRVQPAQAAPQAAVLQQHRSSKLAQPSSCLFRHQQRQSLPLNQLRKQENNHAATSTQEVS